MKLLNLVLHGNLKNLVGYYIFTMMVSLHTEMKQ